MVRDEIREVDRGVPGQGEPYKTKKFGHEVMKSHERVYRERQLQIVGIGVFLFVLLGYSCLLILCVSFWCTMK